MYRLIEYLASMGRSSIWKLICAISVSNILTVGVHLSSTPSISGPGSATDNYTKFEYKVMKVFELQITQLRHPKNFGDRGWTKKMSEFNTPQK